MGCRDWTWRRSHAAPQALAKGELDEATWRHVDRSLGTAERALADFLDGGGITDLDRATGALHGACDVLIDPSQVPPPAADDDGCQIQSSTSYAWSLLLPLIGFALVRRQRERDNPGDCVRHLQRLMRCLSTRASS